MAAFTLKEMDTEIPAGKAKTRGYAMAGVLYRRILLGNSLGNI